MKDRFVLNYTQKASKPAPKPAPEDGNVIRPTKAGKHQLLHDHRSSDALIEYLDNLEG